MKSGMSGKGTEDKSKGWRELETVGSGSIARKVRKKRMENKTKIYEQIHGQPHTWMQENYIRILKFNVQVMIHDYHALMFQVNNHKI